MPRLHNKSHFFKYVDQNAAKLIIKKQTLKWTSPLAFNDPFDHKVRSLDIDDLKGVAERAVANLVNSIWDNDSVQFDCSRLPGALLTIFRTHKHKITKSEFLKELEGVTDEMVNHGKIAHQQFDQYYTKLLEKTRVVCVSEENDSILMWSHYANSHRGAVFKLNAIDELDTSLLVARKVIYSNTYPCLQTEDEMFNQVFCAQDIDYDQRVKDLVYVKSDVWSYEKEWRISIQGDISFTREPSAVFGAIYLGCMMSKEDSGDIVNLAKIHLPEIEIWKAVQSSTVYKLRFERLY